MATVFKSAVHTFSIDDITGTYGGETFADNASFIDTTGSVVDQFTDKDGNVLSAVDSEFGFHVTDFLGAEDKEIDGDYAEGFAGNILDPADSSVILGLALQDAETNYFRSGNPLGTWALGLGGATVKASTEHYNSMASVLSDQASPDDPNALLALDNDLRLLDLYPTGPNGALEAGAKHEMYVEELSEALQKAIDNTAAGTNPQTYSDIDFDRDGTLDTYTTMSMDQEYDPEGDGTTETIKIGGVDLDADGVADIADSWLNGYGTEADLVDLLEPNESTVTNNIAYSTDYSITLKDDGKLLYRWGTAVKRPNDLRMEVDLELPDEWTEDLDANGTADILEGGKDDYVVTRAELVITHNITNNPNDQVRPEDYENEAAIGRLPSYYIIQDPEDDSNTLWVSPRDSFNGEGVSLPSYFKLNAAGEIDLTAGGVAIYSPTDVLLGYRNEDADGNPIGTVFRDMSLADDNEAADLSFESEDLTEGFTSDWYTTVDREPFEWSYDKFSDDPYRQDFVSFRSAEEAEAAGYSEDELASGPRWRLTPNKFGQDLPGLEVPLTENTSPPYQKDNIKYETGELTTTRLNLLDWEGESPLSYASGWMAVDPTRLDENADGIIDAGWSKVNGTLGAGDALPTGPILTAVTPNGVNMSQNFLDTAVYVKGDRQDTAKLYDITLEIDYFDGVIGAVQQVSGLNHLEQTIAYQDDEDFTNPVAFALAPTLIGDQAASVTFTDVGTESATLYIEEPNYLDGIHLREDVSLMTFEEGNFTLSDGSRVEIGTAQFQEGRTNVLHSVEFEQAFDEAPTMLLQLQTKNGAEWAVVRADNVTTTGFDYALQEQESADGIHKSEIVGWAAIDASAASGVIDWNGMTAQATTIENAVNHDGFDFAFDSALGLDPLVSGAMTSFNGADTSMLRLAGLSNDGSAATAEFLLQEEQSRDAEVAHSKEDLSILAFESEGLLQGTITPDADAFMFV